MNLTSLIKGLQVLESKGVEHVHSEHQEYSDWLCGNKDSVTYKIRIDTDEVVVLSVFKEEIK